MVTRTGFGWNTRAQQMRVKEEREKGSSSHSLLQPITKKQMWAETVLKSCHLRRLKHKIHNQTHYRYKRLMWVSSPAPKRGIRRETKKARERERDSTENWQPTAELRETKDTEERQWQHVAACRQRWRDAEAETEGSEGRGDNIRDSGIKRRRAAFTGRNLNDITRGGEV